MYTTELDKSQYTPEQIAAAEKIAAIIESEKNQSNGVGGGVNAMHNSPGMPGSFGHLPTNSYQNSDTHAFFEQQKQHLSMPTSQQQPTFQHPQQNFIQSNTFPLQNLSQQQYYKQTAAQSATPGYVTPPEEQFMNEMKVVAWLMKEMQRVLTLIGTHGEPTPHQAAKLLHQYTGSVTQLIPYSPPDVKVSVIGLFKKCNWDVPTKRGIGNTPPGGKTLCDLIFELGVYFCNRTNQKPPPPGFVEQKLAEYRTMKANNASHQRSNGTYQHGRGQHQPIPQPSSGVNHGRSGFGARGGKGGYRNNYHHHNHSYSGRGGGKGKGGGINSNRANNSKGGKIGSIGLKAGFNRNRA